MDPTQRAECSYSHSITGSADSNRSDQTMPECDERVRLVSLPVFYEQDERAISIDENSTFEEVMKFRDSAGSYDVYLRINGEVRFLKDIAFRAICNRRTIRGKSVPELIPHLLTDMPVWQTPNDNDEIDRYLNCFNEFVTLLFSETRTPINPQHNSFEFKILVTYRPLLMRKWWELERTQFRFPTTCTTYTLFLACALDNHDLRFEIVEKLTSGAYHDSELMFLPQLTHNKYYVNYIKERINGFKKLKYLRNYIGTQITKFHYSPVSDNHSNRRLAMESILTFLFDSIENGPNVIALLLDTDKSAKFHPIATRLVAEHLTLEQWKIVFTIGKEAGFYQKLAQFLPRGSIIEFDIFRLAGNEDFDRAIISWLSSQDPAYQKEYIERNFSFFTTPVPGMDNEARAVCFSQILKLADPEFLRKNLSYFKLSQTHFGRIMIEELSPLPSETRLELERRYHSETSESDRSQIVDSLQSWVRIDESSTFEEVMKYRNFIGPSDVYLRIHGKAHSLVNIAFRAICNRRTPCGKTVAELIPHLREDMPPSRTPSKNPEVDRYLNGFNDFVTLLINEMKTSIDFQHNSFDFLKFMASKPSLIRKWWELERTQMRFPMRSNAYTLFLSCGLEISDLRSNIVEKLISGNYRGSELMFLPQLKENERYLNYIKTKMNSFENRKSLRNYVGTQVKYLHFSPLSSSYWNSRPIMETILSFLFTSVEKGPSAISLLLGTDRGAELHPRAVKLIAKHLTRQQWITLFEITPPQYFRKLLDSLPLHDESKIGNELIFFFAGVEGFDEALISWLNSQEPEYQEEYIAANYTEFANPANYRNDERGAVLFSQMLRLADPEFLRMKLPYFQLTQSHFGRIVINELSALPPETRLKLDQRYHSEPSESVSSQIVDCLQSWVVMDESVKTLAAGLSVWN